MKKNRGEEKTADQESVTLLPPLRQGEAIRCESTRVHEKQTTPPKHFTEATLLDAMTSIARYVQDPEIKKVLRETDGLGTPATQAGIIAKPKSPADRASKQKVVAVGKTCPDCKKGKIQLRSLKSSKNAGKPFHGCSTFPKCRYFAWPADTTDEVSA